MGRVVTGLCQCRASRKRKLRDWRLCHTSMGISARDSPRKQLSFLASGPNKLASTHMKSVTSVKERAF